MERDRAARVEDGIAKAEERAEGGVVVEQRRPAAAPDEQPFVAGAVKEGTKGNLAGCIDTRVAERIKLPCRIGDGGHRAAVSDEDT